MSKVTTRFHVLKSSPERRAYLGLFSHHLPWYRVFSSLAKNSSRWALSAVVSDSRQVVL